MIVAHSSIYHRPSSSSPIVSGASSSSSSPTNRDPFRARAARMEKSSSADRPRRVRAEPRQKPEGSPRGAAIAPVAVDVISRPRGGRNRSAGCRRSFGAEFPSELADESEQRAVGRFFP